MSTITSSIQKTFSSLSKDLTQSKAPHPSIQQLQSHLLNLWTSCSVDQTYQNLFLIFIQSFESPKDQVREIEAEIKKTYEKNSLYFLLQENLGLKTEIKAEIQEQIVRQTKSGSFRKSQKVDIVLRQLCDKLKNLRRINLLIAENILKIFQDFKVNRQSSLGSIAKKYIEIFVKIDVENQFIKQSFLNEFMLFQKGYDPFFLVHYEQTKKSQNVFNLKKHPPVSELFEMNISYVYRLMRAQQKMLKYMLLIDDHTGAEKERKEIINRQRLLKIANSSKTQPNEERDQVSFLPVINKTRQRSGPHENLSVASTVKPFSPMIPRRPNFLRNVDQKDESEFSSYVRKKMYSLRPIDSEELHSSINSSTPKNSTTKNGQRNHSLVAMKGPPNQNNIFKHTSFKSYQTQEQQILMRHKDRYKDSNQGSRNETRNSFLNSQSQKKWNLKKALQDRRQYLRPIKSEQTNERIIEEGSEENQKDYSYKRTNQYLENKYPVYVSLKKSKLADSDVEELTKMPFVRSRKSKSKHIKEEQQFNRKKSSKKKNKNRQKEEKEKSRHISKSGEKENKTKKKHRKKSSSYDSDDKESILMSSQQNSSSKSVTQSNDSREQSTHRYRNSQEKSSNLSRQSKDYKRSKKRKLQQDSDRDSKSESKSSKSEKKAKRKTKIKQSKVKNDKKNDKKKRSGKKANNESSEDVKKKRNKQINQNQRRDEKSNEKEKKKVRPIQKQQKKENVKKQVVGKSDVSKKESNKLESQNHQMPKTSLPKKQYKSETEKQMKAKSVDPKQRDTLQKRKQNTIDINDETKSADFKLRIPSTKNSLSTKQSSTKEPTPSSTKESIPSNTLTRHTNQIQDNPLQPQAQLSSRSIHNSSMTAERKPPSSSSHPISSSSKIKMIPGKISISQFPNFIKTIKVIPAYSQQLSQQVKFVFDSAQNTQTYLNQFHLNDQLAAIALCSPTASGNIVIYLWIPIEGVCDQKTSHFFFKKYIDYLEQQTTFKAIIYSGMEIPELKRQGFDCQRERNFIRKRTKPITRQNFQFEYFFSMEVTNISFAQASQDSLFFSDEITPLSNFNSWCNPIILNLEEEKLSQQNEDQWIFDEKIKSITEANLILEKDSYDTFEVGEQKIVFQNINMSRAMISKVPKYGFIVNEGYMIVMGKSIIFTDIKKKINKMELMNDICLYFGDGFENVQQICEFLQKTKDKAKLQDSKFAFKMFSKQLYGRYAVKDFQLQKQKAYYCNWDMNFAWRDEIPGKIIHDLSLVKNKYGPQKFICVVQTKGMLALGIEIIKEDFLY